MVDVGDVVDGGAGGAGGDAGAGVIVCMYACMLTVLALPQTRRRGRG